MCCCNYRWHCSYDRKAQRIAWHSLKRGLKSAICFHCILHPIALASKKLRMKFVNVTHPKANTN